MKNINFILMVLFATSVCFSQSNFWKKSKLNSLEHSSYVKNLQKDKYQIFSLDYDKLIWELGDDNNPAWIHVSYVKGNNRKLVYQAKRKEGKAYSTYHSFELDKIDEDAETS